jgi:hypothetical protein
VAVVAAAVRACMSNRRIVYRSHAHAALLVAVVAAPGIHSGTLTRLRAGWLLAALLVTADHVTLRCMARACVACALALVSRWLAGDPTACATIGPSHPMAG